MNLYYATTQDDAERLAASLSPQIGKHASLTPNGYDKTVTGYRVERYAGGKGFGIVERWVYDDRPDIGEMGGGYVDLNNARRLINR
jgi:hypothetical protein